jgi:hypothetical protein
MSAPLISLLCFAAVLISGGSLYRKGRLGKRTFVVVIAMMAAVVGATAVLSALGTR